MKPSDSSRCATARIQGDTLNAEAILFLFMNPQTHTRGPWCIETPCDGFSIVEADKPAHEWRFIAHIPVDKENGIPLQEVEANAQLIASAPEMFSALANCYATARRQAARLSREHAPDGKAVEAWNHVIRFCEGAGQRASLLRESMPTDMTGG